MFFGQFTQTAVILMAIALFGLGCNNKSSAPAQEPSRADAGSVVVQPDAGNTIPEGWQVYRNEEWGISFPYPPGWYGREQKLMEGELTVFLHPEPIPTELSPEPLFAVTVSAERAVFEKSLEQYGDLEYLPVLVAGQAQWERFRYFSDLLEQYDVVHLRNFDGVTISVVADEVTAASDDFIPILQSMEVR